MAVARFVDVAVGDSGNRRSRLDRAGPDVEQVANLLETSFRAESGSRTPVALHSQPICPGNDRSVRLSVISSARAEAERRMPGSALVVVAAGCYPDLVFDDL